MEAGLLIPGLRRFADFKVTQVVLKGNIFFWIFLQNLNKVIPCKVRIGADGHIGSYYGVEERHVRSNGERYFFQGCAVYDGWVLWEEGQDLQTTVALSPRMKQDDNDCVIRWI